MAAKTSKPMLALILAAGITGGFIGIWSASSGGFGILAVVGGLLAFGIAVAVALRHNRSIPTASPEEKDRALSLPDGGAARVIVVREGFVGKLAGVDVAVDGRPVTQLKSPRFAAIDLPPGEHRLVASIQKNSSAPLSMALEPGEVAVARVTVALGAVAIDRERDTPALRGRLQDIRMVSSS